MKKFFIPLVILFGSMANAQWTTDYSTNTQVSAKQSLGPLSISTSDGKTYVVYWQSAAKPVNFALYVQLIDKDGNKLFGTQGVLVNPDLLSDTYISSYNLSVDKNNNLYIGYTSTGNSSTGYIQKVTPAGLMPWGNNGKMLQTSTYDVKIWPTDHSGIYVAYENGDSGYLNLYNTDNGNAIWSDPVPMPVPNANYQYTSIGEGAVLSDDSFISLVHARTGSDILSNFFAQRYSATGNALWNKYVKLSNRSTSYINRYDVILENDILYLGYFGSSSTRFDSYLQKIDASGNIPWGINGVDFSTNNTNFEMYTNIAKEPGSQYIWSICTEATTSQGSRGEYLQKFDITTGARLLTDNAKELFPIDGGKIHRDNLQLLNGKPTLLLSNADSNGVNADVLSVSYLDDNGNFILADKYKDIATSAAPKGYVNFGSSKVDQVTAVWSEDKSNGSITKTYIQNYVFDNMLSTADIPNKNNVRLFPNPVKDVIHINSDSKVNSLQILDVAGNNISESKNSKIDVENLTKGNYLLKVNFANGTSTIEKFIKN